MNNTCFIGNIVNGLAEGRGCIVDIRNKNLIYYGEFENGKYSGDGTLYHNGSITYKGQFKNGCKHGIGFEYKNDSLYSKGEYNMNRKEGRCEQYRYDSKLFEGVWIDDKCERIPVLND